MKLLFGCSELIAAWVRARIPFMDPDGFGPCQSIGVVDSAGRIAGGVVFHGWSHHYRSLEVSCAADTAKWLSRGIIRGILSYPFNQLNVHRLSSITRPDDTRTRHVLEALGFTYEGTGRGVFGPDIDGASYALIEHDWRAGRFGIENKQERVSHG
jgi:RimJ/RimL family protein N-acetyltransferase